MLNHVFIFFYQSSFLLSPESLVKGINNVTKNQRDNVFSILTDLTGKTTVA